MYVTRALDSQPRASSDARLRAPSTAPDFIATSRVPASGTKESFSFRTAGLSPHQASLRSSRTWSSAANSVIRYGPVPSSSVFDVPIRPWLRVRKARLLTRRPPAVVVQANIASGAFSRMVTSWSPEALTDSTPA